jgi:hypothetical protein
LSCQWCWGTSKYPPTLRHMDHWTIPRRAAKLLALSGRHDARLWRLDASNPS